MLFNDGEICALTEACLLAAHVGQKYLYILKYIGSSEPKFSMKVTQKQIVLNEGKLITGQLTITVLSKDCFASPVRRKPTQGTRIRCKNVHQWQIDLTRK